MDAWMARDGLSCVERIQWNFHYMADMEPGFGYATLQCSNSFCTDDHITSKWEKIRK